MSDDGVDTLIRKIRTEDDSEAHKILRSYLGNKACGHWLADGADGSTSMMGS